jgi:hypothetical protein
MYFYLCEYVLYLTFYLVFLLDTIFFKYLINLPLLHYLHSHCNNSTIDRTSIFQWTCRKFFLQRKFPELQMYYPQSFYLSTAPFMCYVMHCGVTFIVSLSCYPLFTPNDYKKSNLYKMYNNVRNFDAERNYHRTRGQIGCTVLKYINICVYLDQTSALKLNS